MSVSSLHGSAFGMSSVSSVVAPDVQGGFMDYNDATGAVALVADTWTTIDNDGAGSFTLSTYKPDGVTDLVNVANGALDFSGLALGEALLIRNDFTIVPSVNNVYLQFRYNLGTGGGAYSLDRQLGSMSNGAGISYRHVFETYIYMGDSNTRDNPGVLQVNVSEASTFTNAGSVIHLFRENR